VFVKNKEFFFITKKKYFFFLGKLGFF